MLTLKKNWPFTQRLLADLARQFCSCGLFMNVLGVQGEKNKDLEKRAIDEYAALRLGFLQSITKVLLETDHAVTDAGVPYCFNLGGWNADDGVCGYTESGRHGIDTVMGSYFSTWRLEALEGTTSFHRVLKSLLWQHEQNGSEMAIRFAIQGLRAGLFSGTKAVTYALWAYLNMLQDAQSGAELLIRAFDGRKPRNQREWISAELADLGELELLDAASLREPLQVLLEMAIEAGTVAREAGTYDEWLAQQFFLRKFLDLVLQIFEQLKKPPGLGVQAKLAMLHEVRADAGGVVQLVQAVDALGPAPLCILVAAVTTGLINADAPNWKQNLMTQRAICPTVLGPQLSPDGSLDVGSLPEQWRGLSPKCAPSVLIGATSQDPKLSACYAYDPKRLVAPSAEEMEQISLQLQKQLDIIAEKERGSRLQELVELQARYRWDAALLWELAIIYDETGDLAGAQRAIQDALLLEPRVGALWQSAGVIQEHMGCKEESLFLHHVSKMIGGEYDAVSR
jgi:hypothetical protein